jgi:hypothetical protein
VPRGLTETRSQLTSGEPLAVLLLAEGCVPRTENLLLKFGVYLAVNLIPYALGFF